jgi:hypothetical protein
MRMCSLTLPATPRSRAKAEILRKEGWLVKTNEANKKQARYFRLHGQVLTWSKDPAARPLSRRLPC